MLKCQQLLAFNIYEQDNQAQLSYVWKKFYILEACFLFILTSTQENHYWVLTTK